MKNLLAPLFLLVTLLIIVNSCTKDEPEPEQQPVIEFAIDSLYITEIYMIDSGAIDPSIRISFHADNLVKAQIEEMGFVWADHTDPLVTDNKIATMAGMDDRRFDLTDTIALTGRGKQIYIRAFVQNTKKEVYYSDEKILDIRKITTAFGESGKYIVQPFSAFIYGSVIEGSDEIFEWGAIVDTNPITSETQGRKFKSEKVLKGRVLTMDTFKIEGLEKLTQYNVKFYVKTEIGVEWGENVLIETPGSHEWVEHAFIFPHYEARIAGTTRLMDFYATIDGKLYQASSNPLDKSISIQKYELGSDSWEIVTKFPVQATYTRFHFMHFDENAIYLGFGVDGNGVANFIWRYDLKDNSWLTIALPSGLSGSTHALPISFVVADNLFSGFGQRDDTFFMLNKLFQFSPLKNDWSQVSSLEWIKGTVYPNFQIYFAQGFDDHAVALVSGSRYIGMEPTGLRFDLATSKIERTSLPDPLNVEFSFNQFDPVVNTNNGRSYVLIGNKLLIYDSELEEWDEIDAPAGLYDEIFSIDNTVYLRDRFDHLFSYTFE